MQALSLPSHALLSLPPCCFLIDTVIAVSIFVSADIATLLVGLGVAVLADVVLLRVLLKLFELRRSKPSAVSI